MAYNVAMHSLVSFYNIHSPQNRTKLAVQALASENRKRFIWPVVDFGAMLSGSMALTWLAPDLHLSLFQSSVANVAAMAAPSTYLAVMAYMVGTDMAMVSVVLRALTDC